MLLTMWIPPVSGARLAVRAIAMADMAGRSAVEIACHL
jgi:hypothetical protein